MYWCQRHWEPNVKVGGRTEIRSADNRERHTLKFLCSESRRHADLHGILQQGEWGVSRNNDGQLSVSGFCSLGNISCLQTKVALNSLKITWFIRGYIWKEILYSISLQPKESWGSGLWFVWWELVSSRSPQLIWSTSQDLFYGLW